MQGKQQVDNDLGPDDSLMLLNFIHVRFDLLIRAFRATRFGRSWNTQELLSFARKRRTPYQGRLEFRPAAVDEVSQSVGSIGKTPAFL